MVFVQPYKILAMIIFSLREKVSCCEFIRYTINIQQGWDTLMSGLFTNVVSLRRYHYFIYCQLLERYLVQKYGPNNWEQAEQKYRSLEQILEHQMGTIIDYVGQISRSFDVEQIPGELAEIYNLL